VEEPEYYIPLDLCPDWYTDRDEWLLGVLTKSAGVIQRLSMVVDINSYTVFERAGLLFAAVVISQSDSTLLSVMDVLTFSSLEDIKPSLWNPPSINIVD